MKRCLGCMEMYEDEYDICPNCGFVEGTEAEEAIHMNPGTLLNDRYIVGKVLGYGGFGVTYIGWDGKLEQKVAIKEYLPSEFSTRMPGQSRVTVFNGDKNEQFYDGLKKFVEEAKRLAKFQNESGIVKVFDSFVENDTAYIIMEYLEGETLTARLKREKTIPEEEAVKLLMPVMESLQAVHEEGILHRDIAPDNIFLTKDGEVKLIDFGASRYATTSHSRSLTVIIKPGYSPEEQYRSSGDQGPHTDVYALGACLYKMITGKTPPDAMERRAKFESQNKDILEAPHKLKSDITLVRENAILNAMNVRIEDRTPNVREMMEELNSTVPIKRRNGKIRKLDIYGWPKWFKATVAAVVLALVTVGTLMVTGVIKVDSLFNDSIEIPDGMAQVPLVEGIKNAKATQKLESKSFNAAIAGTVTSEFVEAGKIVRQDPAAGKFCEKDSVIYLYISRGNGEVILPSDGKATVPYLVGSTEEDALKDLKKAGLADPEIAYEYDDNFKEGLVMNQSKQYMSTLNEGSSIKITVSKGSKPFSLPDVTKLKLSEAEQTLKALGLEVVSERKETRDVPGGIVMEQSVQANTEVHKFDVITLTVAEALWSEWSETKPQDKEGRTIESKTQYSYSDYETAEQSDNGSMAGWERDDSKTRTYYGDDYGAWSEWTTAAVASSDTRKVESKTQYQYRDKVRKTSNEANLSGWTLIKTESSYTDYGSWSGWQEGAVSESNTRQVETKTQYSYYFYTCPSCGAHLGWFNTSDRTSGKCRAYGGNCDAWNLPDNCTTFWSDSAPNSSFSNSWTGEGKRVGQTAEHGRAYYWGGTRTVYRYRDRSLVYTYTYEKWNGWTDWSDTAVSASSTREVNTQNIYRYADKILHTTYSFYRWLPYTEYSDTKVNESETRKVKTRVLYKYIDVAE